MSNGGRELATRDPDAKIQWAWPRVRDRGQILDSAYPRSRAYADNLRRLMMIGLGANQWEHVLRSAEWCVVVLRCPRSTSTTVAPPGSALG